MKLDQPSLLLCIFQMLMSSLEFSSALPEFMALTLDLQGYPILITHILELQLATYIVLV